MCSRARSYTTLPERGDASWDNNVKLARLAESVGLDCLVPIARWKATAVRRTLMALRLNRSPGCVICGIPPSRMRYMMEIAGRAALVKRSAKVTNWG